MKTVIADTNFVVQCLARKIDLFSELERICDFPFEIKMLDKSLLELEKVAIKGDSDERAGARLAKQLVQQERIGIIKTSEDKPVDALLIKMAGPDMIIATQDRVVKEKVKAKGGRLIVIRQMKYLELQ